MMLAIGGLEMSWHKTLPEIRAELRVRGVDLEEPHQLYGQPRVVRTETELNALVE
jgi:hypothetical protein